MEAQGLAGYQNSIGSQVQFHVEIIQLLQGGVSGRALAQRCLLQGT